MRRRRRCLFDSGSCGMTGVRGSQSHADRDYSNKTELRRAAEKLEDVFFPLAPCLERLVFFQIQLKQSSVVVFVKETLVVVAQLIGAEAGGDKLLRRVRCNSKLGVTPPQRR